MISRISGHYQPYTMPVDAPLNGAKKDRNSHVGLIIRKVPVTDGLAKYLFTVWRDGEEIPLKTAPVTASVEWAFTSIWPLAREYGPGWVSGRAATVKLARAMGLAHRKRAPGAGRKPLEGVEERVRLAVWVKKSTRTRLLAMKKTGEAESLGAVVDALCKNNSDTLNNVASAI